MTISLTYFLLYILSLHIYLVIDIVYIFHISRLRAWTDFIKTIRFCSFNTCTELSSSELDEVGHKIILSQLRLLKVLKNSAVIP